MNAGASSAGATAPAQQAGAEPARPASVRQPRPARPRPARERRRSRTLRQRLLSPGLRVLLALGIASAITMVLVLTIPELNYVLADDQADATAAAMLITVATVAAFGVINAALTYWAATGVSRNRLVASMRLLRVQRYRRLYRWVTGYGGPVMEVLQLMLSAGIAIALMVMKPPGIAIPILLAFTIGALASAWIGSVMTYALEYVAEDAWGDAFDLHATPGPERSMRDYVYAATLIQTTAGVGDFLPRTSAARKLVRDQAVLAHVTVTILITLGVSVVVTALG